MNINKNLKASLLIISIIFFLRENLHAQNNGYKPKDGFVPNSETAIKIAEAIWLPIYGDRVLNEKPYIASLQNKKIWIVKSTLHSQKGGVAYIEIQKADGKILIVIHGK